MDRYARSHFAPETLFTSARRHAGLEITSIAELLADLGEIDAHKHYAPAGYESMLAYCLAELPYTEDEARNRIRAARVAREYPAILPMLADGRLLLTAVLRLATCLRPENFEGLIAAAAGKSMPELEVMLRARFPRPDVFTWVERPVPGSPSLADSRVPERTDLHVAAARTNGRCEAKPLSAQSFGIQFPLTQEEYALVVRSRELRPASDEKEVFMRALRAHVAQMEKRKLAVAEKPIRCPRPTGSARHIPAHVRRAVCARDGCQCTFVGDNGHRCDARRGLQYDHVVPLARGGEATVDNIRLLCRTHNQYEAERTYGEEFMRRKREAAAETRAKREADKRVHDEQDKDIIAGLRTLGYNANQARSAAAFSRDMPDATLEERMRRALSYFRLRGTRVQPFDTPVMARSA
ncbi:MAG TPA: HNH endonuclease [Candidatus Eisenbacteria bacterium]|nr:HNH endonuclease [Candidatus Eisenbacteria bacterium]